MPFRLMPKSTTLMTLNGRYTLCCSKDASFGATTKMAKICWTMSLVSGGITFTRIFAEVPIECATKTNDSWVVENGNFQRFRWLFFSGNFRDEASVII